ncbi:MULTISPECIES: dTMP kinase [Mycolicibacterium]|uniref:Thymidylate kinase n=2 Tax=Mycolicibacterium gilvum TaxID=1804 RepID=E6TPD2_MYCSR|nr:MULTISPECIES: dTMP kinase [Mycolicibacterium]ABP47182.1 thymidylate kinase [Mycolicibacterium gilvum PYR-GCK]ADU00634.1 thymidylate kinase [Mycolicibacterium gilvum Spyr1]MBV5245430.1 dTMP kinase [Mycolicibacterium sp. PAM1]
MLIVIEGVDGAGKRTLTNGLRAAFESGGRSVATLAFPRYGVSVPADVAAEALHGQHGDLADSVYAMAMLFAMDRAGARDEIGHLTSAYSVVILDRYVASNAAYSAARLHQGADGDVVAWVRDLEYGRLKLPVPTWQVLLDVPTELAAQRAVNRAAEDAARARDAYERDDGLQRRTGAVYAELAAAQWGGPWAVIPPDVDAAELAARLLG